MCIRDSIYARVVFAFGVQHYGATSCASTVSCWCFHFGLIQCCFSYVWLCCNNSLTSQFVADRYCTDHAVPSLPLIIARRAPFLIRCFDTAPVTQMRHHRLPSGRTGGHLLHTCQNDRQPQINVLIRMRHEDTPGKMASTA